MRYNILKVGALALCVATTALAHSGVKDQQVMARMTVMTDIAADTKRLSAYVNGTTAFDKAAVQRIGRTLVDHADKTLDLFEVQAADPKSEAKELVWTDWKGFVAANSHMKKAAIAITNVTSADALQSAFKELGQSCTTCHKTYRLAK